MSEEFGDIPLDESDEKALLMSRWMKLLKARETNEQLAITRSEDNKHSVLICCAPGKKRKKPPYDDAVKCDLCLGWTHKGCMSPHAWNSLGDTYVCRFCATLPPEMYELRPVTRQNASNEFDESAVMGNKQVAQHEADEQLNRFTLMNPEDSMLETEDQEEEAHLDSTVMVVQERVTKSPPPVNDNPRDHTASKVQNRSSSVRETLTAQSNFSFCGICQKNITTFDYFTCACGMSCHTLCSYLIMPEYGENLHKGGVPITDDDKAAPPLCDFCERPAGNKKNFTSLGECSSCKRLLHTACSGLPSVVMLDWAPCADCRREQEERTEKHQPLAKAAKFSRSRKRRDNHTMQTDSGE